MRCWKKKPSSGCRVHIVTLFCGDEAFESLADEEPGSFYLTDFLVAHFQRLVIQGLGLDRHPQLLPAYFGNYRRVVYLAQTESTELQGMAREHADRLGLEFAYRFFGDQPLARRLRVQAEGLRP